MMSSSKLRIAVWYNLPSGGGKRALHDHVRGLKARGHYVEAWCPDVADRSYLPLGEFVQEHVVPLGLRPNPPRRGLRRILGPYLESEAKLQAFDTHARRCAAEIDSGNFDVAFLNTCEFMFAPTVARHVRTPSVLYLQEPNRLLYETIPGPEGPRQSWVGWPKPARLGRPSLLQRKRDMNGLAFELSSVHALRVQAREELLNARACGTVLCNSLFSHESMLRCYGLDARVCYLGIDTAVFRPVPDPKRPYVIGLGSFIRNKGLDRAVTALATIAEARRPELVWVGNLESDDELQYIRGLAQDCGVRFTARGLVSQDELVDLLGRAAVMIYTSRLEPFGFAPLEANACGTAVVALAEAGIRETVRHGVNGMLVDPGDFDAMGRAVLAYTEDLDRARTDGLQARRYVEDNWGLPAAIDRIERELWAASGQARPAGRSIDPGGLMVPKVSDAVHQQPRIGPAPVSEGTARPFWSVMIPAYNPSDLLEATLRSVLDQDPGPDRMQIAVVDDASPDVDVQTIVRAIAGDRVEFHRNAKNLRLAGSWNRCIELAQGRWVHLLHQDDLILPGFYERMGVADEAGSEVGVALCQNAFVDADGHWLAISPLERASTGRLGDGWLDQFMERQPVQCPAVVVRREVYEQLGGFRGELLYVLDWEMWVRIVAHGVGWWYEPAVLACYREHDSSETMRLRQAGALIEDIERGVRISQTYLPAQLRKVHGLRNAYCGTLKLAARDALEAEDWRSGLAYARRACRLDSSLICRSELLNYYKWALKVCLRRGLRALRLGWGRRQPSPVGTPPSPILASSSGDSAVSRDAMPPR